MPMYEGGLLDNLAATASPAASNNAAQGYSVGSRWVNTSTGQVWVYVAESGGAAVWEMMDVADHPGYVTAGTYSLGDTIGAAGIMTDSTMMLFPFMVKTLVTLTKLGIRSSAAVATAAAKGGIWASNPATQRPTSTPFSYADGAGSGLAIPAINTSYQLTLTNPTQLVPGRLYFAGSEYVNSASLTCVNGASLIGSRILGLPVNTNLLQAHGYTVTLSALAGTPSFATAINLIDLTSATFNTPSAPFPNVVLVP